MFFSRELRKKQLNYILNDEQWLTKHYDQGQKTYIVLLDQQEEFCNRVKKYENNPLAALANQRVVCKQKNFRYKKEEVIGKKRVQN